MQTVEAILERPYTLRACDVDCQGRWRLDALLTAAQEISSEHSAMLGYSEAALSAQHVAWILSRTHLSMSRWPTLGERISIATWPGAREKLFFPRYLSFAGQDGEPIGAIHAQWLLFDTVKRELLNPRHFPIVYPVTSDRPAPTTPPEKIYSPEHITHTRSVMPLYTDIDINQHVNNTRYASWISDLYSISWHREHVLQDLTIQYLNEVLPGQILVLATQNEGNSLHVMGCDESYQSTYFTAAGLWRDARADEAPPAAFQAQCAAHPEN